MRVRFRRIDALVVTALLLIENGIEAEILHVLEVFGRNLRICLSMGLLIKALIQFQKPYRRLVKNQKLVECITAIERDNPTNNDVVDIYSQLLIVFKEGSASLTKFQSEEQEYVKQFGEIPKRPPPPLPLGCK